MDQNNAPILEALKKFKHSRVVPFDVPGHKRGLGNKELTDFLGKQCLAVDVNSMKPLDNLCHPISVIKEAEQLAADAFGAGQAFFIVNGTSAAVQNMIFAVAKRGDKIILPRNVHRSVINALILCGAVPVYINPQTNARLGISLGMSVIDIEHAIKENPDAKAILINNPTYYGICSNIAKITKLAHAHGMKVLADEAHGTHFYFNDSLPISAMAAGADIAAVSLHKSGGSLTQSSMLLCKDKALEAHMRQIINLTQTTSASYLLLSSLDISRKNLSLNGAELFDGVITMANYARDEINAIGDYYAFSRELIDGDSVFNFDETKLSVNTLGLGLAGIEVYNLLRDEYDIQIEFGDIGNFLAYLSVGDNYKNIERLIGALAEIKRLYKHKCGEHIPSEYITPIVRMSPQDAFYSESSSVELSAAIGKICTEFVMCYPPGIPILAPGEEVTRDVVDYISYAKEKGCSLTGCEDMSVSRVRVVG
ncbi:MAG: aminotransferase class I/II-fold pyridoxal phosphate-dependent enzyme [Clostridiales bacterium]|jgi:arginine/lysine/ornithine decarboxylase|nr:aminotransferase class I/II-fold pyridoxal phosphate-dependent enzyme [Clostridiales bacterium]